jgi:hypothetical protein
MTYDECDEIAERILCAASAARLSGATVSLADICAPDGVNILQLPPQIESLAARFADRVPGFAARFCLAVDPARDMSRVWPQWAAWMLRTVALPGVTIDKWGVRKAIETVAGMYESGAAADAAYAAAAYAAYAAAADAADAAAADAADAAAADAARAAAYAAAYAAYAAAYAADAAAADAAYAAAAYAAYAAYAAADAADAAAYRLMADKIIELLRG